MVPSALTYRVRRIEEALDVLLFDRGSRQAVLTAAGRELIDEGRRLLKEIDAIAGRVKRVATGWEPQFTIAVDSIINRTTMLELCEAFFALDPPTRLRLRTETLAGTLEALASGEADLAIGVVAEATSFAGVQMRPLGLQRFVFAVAPHHPLAKAPEPLGDDVIRNFRAIAVADSARRAGRLSAGILDGQDTLTVASMQTKLEAQLRGLGCGFLPTGLAQPYLQTGRLVARQVERPEHQARTSYAWRKTSKALTGRALAWWLEQLEQVPTREALMCLRPGESDLA
jgi:DNA-binding transcriptional LysR family regulator